MLGTSFSIMRCWHSTVSGEQSGVCMGGVWMDPSNVPDGAGGGVLMTVHQVRPRGPGHGILEWEGGDHGPVTKEEY